MHVFKKADNLNIGISKAVIRKYWNFKCSNPQILEFQKQSPLNIGISKAVAPKY
jgi:hypothetical protein